MKTTKSTILTAALTTAAIHLLAFLPQAFLIIIIVLTINFALGLLACKIEERYHFKLDTEDKLVFITLGLVALFIGVMLNLDNLWNDAKKLFPFEIKKKESPNE